MNNIILKAENLSKQYRLGVVGTGTISHDLTRWWHLIRGKEDPFLKIGAVNDRSAAAKDNYVWALQDINFEVKQGEVLGIIGKNGAGKSTLLKILSRVTSPTTGEIKTKGRIASLLEVGTGFHPELTGRENIYLNGAILGMIKSEIKDKEDEIIDFSGCQMYIDTPVKRYSSGMRVRLAFAVAAFLEPDILVIDEVLAVGDAEFQKKAIGKMQDISKGDGRTVLFVSHNMAAVKSLCTRAIVLEHGKAVFEGNQNEAVDYYLQQKEEKLKVDLASRVDRNGNGKILFSKVELYNEHGKKVDSVISGNFLNLKIYLKLNELVNESIVFGMSFKDFDENINALIVSDEMDIDLKDIIKKGYINVNFNKFMMRGGTYNLTLMLSEKNTDMENHIDTIHDAYVLNVLKGDVYKVGRLNREKNAAILMATIN